MRGEKELAMIVRPKYELLVIEEEDEMPDFCNGVCYECMYCRNKEVDPTWPEELGRYDHSITSEKE